MSTANEPAIPSYGEVTQLLEAVAGGQSVWSFEQFVGKLGTGLAAAVGAVVLTGNYPTSWGTPELTRALDGKFVVLIDTLSSGLVDDADVVLPGATWVEKSGTFQNARDMIQAFEQAIPAVELAKSEGQIAMDFAAVLAGHASPIGTTTVSIDAEMAGQVPQAVEVASPMAGTFDAAAARGEMAKVAGLESFASVAVPMVTVERKPDMEVVEI